MTPSRSKEFPFILVQVPRESQDEIHAVLWDHEILGLETAKEDELTECVRVYFDTEGLADRCRKSLLSEYPELTIEKEGSVAYEDWESFLHGGFEPLPVGDLIVVPAENPPPIPEGKRPLYIIPGRGFGTGSHSTTQAILELIVTYSPAGKQVLDVGSGSGILSIAAALLGAEKVIGVEIDIESNENARENTEGNNVSDRVEIRDGSLEQITEPAFPVVYMNIISHVIKQLLAGGLKAHVQLGGVLLASGILVSEMAEMEKEFEAAGFEIVEKKEIREWSAFALRRIA